MSQVDKAFCFKSIVPGHHIYKAVYTPVLEKILTATLEPKSDRNRHAVCVCRRLERLLAMLHMSYRR